MAKQTINLGVIPTGVGGDTPRSANTKINANFDEIYGWGNGGALAPSYNPTFTGTITHSQNVSSEIIQSTPNAVVRYRRFSNISDAVDGGYRIDRWNGADWVEKLRVENTRVGTTTDFDVRKNTPSISMTSPSLVMGWSLFSNISDTVDGGFSIRNLNAGSWTTRMSINTAGVVSAVSFNPTSSADVKDYIEGYAGDACEELDRLVVISYRYRPEFGGPEGEIAGLLAENVHSVWPNATGGNYDETVEEPVINDDGTPKLDIDGKPITVAVTRHVPMNIDMMQTLARTVRAHQQKSRRIKQLEETVASLVERLDAAGI